MEIETPHIDRPNIPTAWNEANIINSAIDDNDISTDQANEIIYEDLLPKILHTKMFIELPWERLMPNEPQGGPLRDLLNQEYDNNQTVLDTLAENNISLSIAMQEGFHTDPLMVESLKRLNEKGIKPTLWLVLDDTLGYWTNKANIEETVDKLEEMIQWANMNNIEIERIGLDYEPPIELLKGLMNTKIPKSIKETYQYIEKSIQNHKKLGNLQEYIDSNLRRIMEEYDISIETYAAMEPLRSISNWLTLKPNNKSDTVTMAYTSTLKKESEENELNNTQIKRRMTNILEKIDENEIPALGIVGSDPNNSPGRDLRKGKEKHLTPEELTFAFKKILGRENPFRTHAVFALDSAETLKRVLIARKQATRE